MNYRAVHDSIIDRARGRERPAAYCERHHVVPTSLGGADDASNLVWLTGREHYLVHWLLHKIHRTKETAFAWYRMSHGRQKVGRYTSHTFVYAKRAKAAAMSKQFSGKQLSPEHREKLRQAKLGKTYAAMGRPPASPLRGSKFTSEQRAKVAAAGKGRRHSAETRARLSAATTGAGNSQYGKTTPPEVRAKISAGMAEYRAKLRELLKGQV